MKNGALIHEQFSRYWFDTEAPLTLSWMGVGMVKCPFDTHMYQEILHATKPDLIIETGVFVGGTTLFLANMCDLMGHGRVLGVELNTERELPEHPRIDYLLGASSTDPMTVSHVAKHAEGKKTMVILDSAHNTNHVLAEMNAYSKFVSKGCYLIVEDTNVHGYSYAIGDIINEMGPAEAIKAWQPTNKGYEVDRRFERLGFSQNPGGYLLRVR